jgi:hypothetical protein
MPRRIDHGKLPSIGSLVDPAFSRQPCFQVDEAKSGSASPVAVNVKTCHARHFFPLDLNEFLAVYSLPPIAGCNMFNTRVILQSIPGVLSIIILVLAGCATPIEVKTASKAQLSVLETLDTAIGDLQQAFDQFHSDKEARIREEGRMLVARQAIATVYPQNRPMKQITADALFESYNVNVRPWIDNALLWRDLDDQVTSLTEQIAGTTDPALKGRYTLALQDLQEVRARIIKNKPKAVAEIEEVIAGDLDRERQTAADVDQLLGVLRSQIAVMKSLATKVDAWLALDVSVSQEQADSLKEALVGAGKQLEGGK